MCCRNPYSPSGVSFLKELFINQPSIIIADEPDAVLDIWNSNIIPEYTLAAEQSVKTEDKFCPVKNGGENFTGPFT